MNFFKLSPDERAEWRNLPATKAALEFIRAQAMTHVDQSLSASLKGEGAAAAAYAGAEHALRVAAERLGSD